MAGHFKGTSGGGDVAQLNQNWPQIDPIDIKLSFTKVGKNVFFFPVPPGHHFGHFQESKWATSQSTLQHWPKLASLGQISDLTRFGRLGPFLDRLWLSAGSIKGPIGPLEPFQLPAIYLSGHRGPDY